MLDLGHNLTVFFITAVCDWLQLQVNGMIKYLYALFVHAGGED